MGAPERAARDRYQLVDRYLADQGVVFLTGLQALARLPLEQLRADRRAGLNTAAFVSGYPGSPLGGYDVTVAAAARLAPELPVVCRPAMNEEYAATAVMGSQLAAAQADALYDGVIGIWYGKAPGVDRASDALRHAVYAGTSMHGGAVAIVGDDPAAKSSTLPSSTAGALADMHMPVLYPGDPAEALDLGRHAIALSRATGLWSALKIVADVADATATVHLHPERIVPVLPLVDGKPYQHRPDGHMLAPHSVEREREIYEVRYELARQYAALNQINAVVVDPGSAELGIVASGITYREVREAFQRLGIGSDEQIRACGIRLLRLGMPLPFDAGTVRAFARGLREVFVIEEKQPNIEALIKDALYGVTDRPAVVGKTDERGEQLVPGHGALDADTLLPILRRRIEARVGGVELAPEAIHSGRALEPLAVQRTPFFCSGCPHNRSTEVPEGSLVGAGIGCHTMTLLMDPGRVGALTGVVCMGNEGTQWIGMADFVARKHFIQNLGDGTYFHSGQLAIQAAVAAKVNITFKLLYNGAVAMTGGQHPEGQLGVPEVARNLVTQGVSRVLITADDTERYRDVTLPDGVEVWERARLLEAQQALAKVPGVTVLIHDQMCAAEARRARKRGKIVAPNQRVAINHRICEGCGHCGEVSNCLSVQPIDTPFGRKTEIDQTTCNLDFSCLEGDCPSFMTITVPRERSDASARTAKKRELPQPPGDLQEPRYIVPEDEYALRITGIGGTGVVTVAQVLGTAAMLDGYHVRGLDQIGLSQKAGPVVSDLRLSRTQPTATNRLGEAQADLLLAFDQLVAGSEKGMLTADPSRTAVVGSTSPTPTGEMITHPRVSLPTPGDLTRRIASVTRPDAQHWADAAEITEDLFGNATTANIFVVGMAYQAGCLPIRAKHIEEAIALNGTSVESNLAAFNWGRAQISAPQAVSGAARRVELTDEVEVVESAHVVPAAIAARIAALGGAAALQRSLMRYAAELRAFQNARTASRWVDVLERVAMAERAVAPNSTRLLEAVAANSFKLIAYKDEYEVARLMTDADGLAAAREVAGRRGKLAWRLHPPILRAMGLSHKIAIGVWAAPLVKLLAKGKLLRGTPFDVFGYTAVRKLERELSGEYVAAIDRVLASLRAESLDAAVELAELPDMVRGYEQIKERRAMSYRQRLREALSAFE
jgi:indolepyruvate ferredoxin oxidoreductase